MVCATRFARFGTNHAKRFALVVYRLCVC